MCGLVGIAGDTSGSWKDLFTELLLFDSMRGMHSTGAGFVHRNDESFHLAKRPGHPFNLFATKEFDEGMASTNPTKVILGHNRYATIGEKSESNAHPFAFKHVMGMHNGTLDKWVIPGLHNHAKYGTDSEAIFSHINEHGLDAALDHMAGAWALVWYDRRDNTINFLNNGKRPLHYCYSDDRSTLLWASEVDMLKYLMGRRFKKVHKDEFFAVTKDVHFSWTVPKYVNDKFTLPTQNKAEAKAVWKYTGPLASSSSSSGSGSSTSTTTTTRTFGTSANSITPFSQRTRTHKWRPPYKDAYGKTITKPEFYKMVGEGCCFCGDSCQKWSDFIFMMGPHIDHRSPYMCESCFNDPDHYDYTQYAI